MARKKRYTEPIGIMISQEMYETLNGICDSKDLSISEFVRTSIADRLAREYNNNQTGNNTGGSNDEFIF